MPHSVLVRALLLGCASLSLASAARAQTDAAAPTATPQVRDTVAAEDDIVVTARRSAENIQSTPVSVTAFSTETLRAANIQNTADLQLKTPGVFLGGSGGRENSVFQIRGQSKALSGFNAPAVVSYFADVPAPTFGSGVSTYDMASVQVLKGPQGTLFGRNTTGGAVLYYPTAPTFDLGGYVMAGYGRFDRREVEGAITLPLVDDILSVRVAGRMDKRDGYTKNLGVGGDLDDVNSHAFRVSLLFQPTDAIKNLTIFDWYRNRYTGDAVVIDSITSNPSLLDLFGVRESITDFLALQKARGPFVVDSDVEPAFNRTTRWGITNRTDIELGDSGMSLVNIFGYRKSYVEYNINTDGTPRLPTAFDPTGNTTLPLLNAGAVTHIEQYTNELQLKGQLFDDKVDWLLGGFYLRSRPYGVNGTGNDVGFPSSNPLATFQYNFYKERSTAVFGNVNIRLDSLLEGLRLNAGLRYTWDREVACVATDNSGNPQVKPDDCPTAPVLIGASVNRAKSNAPTWTVGLDWQANSQLFTYIVSRRGYRSGGINTPTFAGRLVPYQSFGPEKVTDVEAGIRSDWNVGDVKVRLNVSGFVGWYSGVQIVLSGLYTQPGCTPGAPAPISPDGDCDVSNDPQSGTLLVNAGKSRVSGIDYDARIAFTDHFSVTFGGNFLDPKTVKLAAPAAVAPYLSFQKIPFDLVSKRTFTAGLRYSLPLEGNGNLAASFDYYHTSPMTFVNFKLPAYDIANARIDWDNVAGGPIDLSLYMTNVFDKKYLQYGAISGTSLGWNTGIYGAPRQFGFTARYRFGAAAQ